MNVNEAIMKRRSIRSFKSDAVERAKLEEILQAGAYAPSALNNQNRQFIAITDSTLLKRINNAVENAVDRETRERIMSRAQDGTFNFFYNAPVLILVCCDEKERYPQEDCACALENMFLSAYSLGLGTCWVGRINPPEVKEVFNLPDSLVVYGFLVMGYPSDDCVPAPRHFERLELRDFVKEL